MGKNNIENTNIAISWLERVLALVKKYSILDFLKTFLIIFLSGATIFFISEPKAVVEYYTNAVEEHHDELLNKRRENSARVQNCIQKLLYKVGADRVVIVELSNGLKNTSGVPFLRGSVTYEAVNDSVFPIAEMYQNSQLSLFPFANYLYKAGYFQNKVTEVKKIDKCLYYRMLSNEIKYVAGGTLVGKQGVIGFIFITFKAEDPDFNETVLIDEARKVALEASVLLELRQSK